MFELLEMFAVWVAGIVIVVFFAKLFFRGESKFDRIKYDMEEKKRRRRG